jgi:hypothetical protein
MLSFKVLRVQSRTEGDLEALRDRRRLPLMPDFFFPAKETTKPTHHGGHRFRFRVARTDLEAVLDGMFLLERRATLRRWHLRSNESKIYHTAMILIKMHNKMFKDEHWKRPAHQQCKKTLMIHC